MVETHQECGGTAISQREGNAARHTETPSQNFPELKPGCTLLCSFKSQEHPKKSKQRSEAKPGAATGT